MLAKKKKFEFAPPICFVPDAKVQNEAKAKRVYNWMRMACYQYSILNVLLSGIMITILFLYNGEAIKVS